jgi:hypothetical protein
MGRYPILALLALKWTVSEQIAFASIWIKNECILSK